jgi:hypothetical protein
VNLTEIWSRLSAGEPSAAAFAGDEVVIGDTSGLVVRTELSGKVASERPLPAPVHDLSASRDGRVLSVVCGEGEIVLLEGERMVFRKAPGPYFTMIRLGPGAEYVLAMAPSGEGVFLNRYGREMGRLTVPEGADSLVLLPESGEVVTANCEGMLQRFTPWGKPVWRAELFMDAGRIASDDHGNLVLVPVFVYGATALTSTGASVGAYDVGEPVSSVACDAGGQSVLLATLKNRLVVLDRAANVVASERLPSEIRQVALSPDGSRALATTTSGYTHLLALSDRSSSPLLELSGPGRESVSGSYLFRRRIFSPYLILMPPRVEIASDSSFVAVAGGGGRTVVFELDGQQIDERRFAGSLLDLYASPSGLLRVITTKSILTFRPGEGTATECEEVPTELYQVSRAPEGPTFALSEDGDIYRIEEGSAGAEHLYSLPPEHTAAVLATSESIAVALKTGDILLHSHSGEVIGRSGPWPGRPRILAAGTQGLLIGVGKLLVFLRPDGTEGWRYHLATPPRYGVAVPGAFLVVDEPGAAFSATVSGVVRRTFSVGKGRVTPYPDAGEGPGFLKAEGNLLSAVHPDGRPRWRCRLEDEVSYARASDDGRLAGVIAGLDLYLFALAQGVGAGRDLAEASRFLEFTDG